MKILICWASYLLYAALLTTPSLHADGFLGFFETPAPDVLTVTDVTEEGRKWPLPEPGKPVLYEAISFGSKNFPSLPGDITPNPRVMTAFIVKTLAEQGYVQAKEKGVAKVFLSICWGYSRANLAAIGFLGGRKLDLMWELEQNGGMLSPNVLLRWNRSLTAVKVMDTANSDLYIASIQAFDLTKLDAGTQVLLWNTRIACPTRGLWMADALPIMIAAAGPLIGRETEKPVWRDTAELKKARVEFGELKTLELMQPASPDERAEEPAKK
jgi:hypothetical protein